MAEKTKNAEPPTCGLIMPISPFQEYEASHWSEVRDVLERAIAKAEFSAKPVWEHSETDIIHGRIVRNLFDFPIVVCDISGLNANVMFELGMRLAFAKPVVIVVDEKTKIPFDTTAIEHIIYDSTLHFQNTERFISTLSEKLLNVFSAVASNKYRAFLDTFGAFATFEPKSEKLEIDEYVARMLDGINAQISEMRYENRIVRNALNHMSDGEASNIPYIDSKFQRNALGDLASSPTTYWTRDREEKLRQLWIEGFSPSRIAARLGGNISTHSIIRKAASLHLDRDRATQKPE
jgi:GcrA cell cycle regulator